MSAGLAFADGIHDGFNAVVEQNRRGDDDQWSADTRNEQASEQNLHGFHLFTVICFFACAGIIADEKRKECFHQSLEALKHEPENERDGNANDKADHR